MSAPRWHLVLALALAAASIPILVLSDDLLVRVVVLASAAVSVVGAVLLSRQY